MSFLREIDAKLFNAVEQGDLDEVKRCLYREANVLAIKDSHTVVHAAVLRKNFNGKLLKYLLDKIKETEGDVTQYINSKDNEGNTPLMCAIEYRNTKAVEILLEYGVDIEAKNNDGWTALHWSAKKDEWRITRLLIKKGANVYAEDKNGKKALDIARKLGFHSVEDELYKNDYSPKEVARFTGNVALGTAAVVTAGAGILAVGGLLFIPVTIAGGVLGAAKLVVDGLKGAGTVVANASSIEYVDSRPKDFDPDYYNQQRRNIRQFQMKEFKY